MSRDIVFVAGSPSSPSRSSFVANAIAARAEGAGFGVRAFSVRDFNPAEVLLGQVGSPAIQTFLQAVTSSAAIVISTPVYKATYAGALKALVDSIPPDALVAKPALGIATTRQSTHGPEVDRAFGALFAFFRARALESLVVIDDELRWEGGGGILLPPAQQRVDRAARALFAAVASRNSLPAAP